MAKIITFRVVQEPKQLFVICECGAESIRRELPSNQSLVRFSAVLDENDKLVDVEVVSVKE